MAAKEYTIAPRYGVKRRIHTTSIPIVTRPVIKSSTNVLFRWSDPLEAVAGGCESGLTAWLREVKVATKAKPR